MADRCKWLIVQVAALGWDFAKKHAASFSAYEFHRLRPCFPAVTCTAQAAFRTAALVRAHGMPGNGFFDRELRRAFFWEQSAALVRGARIWDAARTSGRRVGLLFWQQSLGEAVDLVLSPKPVHKHHGGMAQDCYSQPSDLYAWLCKRLGRPFNLFRYWGPLAGAASSQWIVDATIEIMRRPDAPEILITYLPHLDYDLQRFGPESPKAARAALVVAGFLDRLRQAAEDTGRRWLFWGDYGIEATCGAPVFPNLLLRDAGFFLTRAIRGRLYPDFHASPAFALADHQIAHVYVSNPARLGAIRSLFEHADGVAEVMDRDAQKERALDAPRAGELMLVASRGRWFAYPWWRDRDEEPDYAAHVDIHNKPGYDPCELFFGWPPGTISRDVSRIRGTHGRGDVPQFAAWSSSEHLGTDEVDLIELTQRLMRGL